jgi:hypothetical protein
MMKLILLLCWWNTKPNEDHTCIQDLQQYYHGRQLNNNRSPHTEAFYNQVETSLNALGTLGTLGRFSANIGATGVNTVVETIRCAVSRFNARRMPNGARSSRFLRGSVGSIPIKLVALSGIIRWWRCSHVNGGGSCGFGCVPWVKISCEFSCSRGTNTRSSDCSSTSMRKSIWNGWRVIVGEGVGVNR